MDTNVTHLDADASIEHIARLPNEPDLDHIAHHAAPLVDETSGDVLQPNLPLRRRGQLLSTVALSVLVVAIGGVLYLSPFNTFVPVPSQLVAFVGDATHLLGGNSPQQLSQANEPGVSSPPTASPSAQKPKAFAHTNPVVAPAASLAATRVPPRPDTIASSLYTAQPREQSLKELLDLHSGEQNAPSDRQTDPIAAKPASNPSATTEAQEPGSLASPAPSKLVPAQVDITSSVTQAALSKTTQPSIVSEPTPVSSAALSAPSPTVPVPTITVSVDAPLKPTGQAPLAQPIQTSPSSSNAAVQVALAKPPNLVLAVPDGHQEQAEVLQYVTGLSSEIARLRTENEMLRKDVARRIAEQDGRLADFNRRVSIAEARAALRSASDAGKSDEAPAEPITRVAAQPVLPQTTPGNPARLGIQPAPTRARFHVQAASPGLALLAEVGRGGGDGAQLQVAVGDQVPGYGVVKSVSQRGPNWVVLTEHGSIE